MGRLPGGPDPLPERSVPKLLFEGQEDEKYLEETPHPRRRRPLERQLVSVLGHPKTSGLDLPAGFRAHLEGRV